MRALALPQFQLSGPTLAEAFSAGRAGANNFDAIRLFAALMVLYSHAWLLSVDGNPTDFISHFTHDQTGMGDLGIGIFFVLSGFLIAQSWRRRPDLADFTRNRVLRIMPALTAVVLASVFLIGPLVTTATQADYWSSGETWAYLLNIVFAYPIDTLPGVFENAAYRPVVNGPLWTLHFEALCYISVAALGALKLLTLRGCLIVHVILLALLVAVSPTIDNDVEDYIRQVATMGGWFYGGVLFAVLDEETRLDWRVAALAAVALLIAGRTGGFDQLWTFAGAYLVLFIGFAALGAVRRVGEVGDVSYGVYIWSCPIQQILATQFFPASPWITVAISTPLSIAIAYASWRLIEKPALKLKKRSLAAERIS